jgi:Ca2+/H+ antiporter, TMEM165/GDT1 family
VVELALYLPAVLAAFLITVLEMTEVVILVIAVSADHPTARPGATGAVAGVAIVSAIAIGVGAAIDLIPHDYLLYASAALLAGFGVYLFRSTLRSYRRAALPPGSGPPGKFAGAVQFGTGLTSGAVEAVEVVVVLLGITAAGYAFSAIVGALVGGAILIVLALLVHERLRRIKVPWLKLLGTSMLFTFATFWFGEAVGVTWPGSDLFLVPLFVVSLVLARAAVGAGMRLTPPRPAAH